MYSNKELKLLLQAKKKRASALNKRAMKGGGNVGRKRNNVMVKDNTQKIFNGVYDVKNNTRPNMNPTPLNLRGGSYSLPVGDIISNAQHNGIMDAQNKYADAWRRRNQYVKF